MIADDIRALLTGLSTGQRCYWDQAVEEPTVPYLRLTETGGEIYLAQEADSGLRSMRFQVSAFAATGTEARSIINAVRSALHMYKDGAAISGIIATSEPFVVRESDTRLYHAAMDFQAWYA